MNAHCLPRLARRKFLVAVGGLLVSTALPAADFDHEHQAWSALLRKHLQVLGGGQASRVRYAGFMADKGALDAYLGALAGVDEDSFKRFNKAQQQAFLLNAYNAATVALILTRYPDVASIKDLGSFLQSPWKSKRVALLNRQVSLDDIEHGMLRAPGRYDDWRVHFAANCASIGCPMLREEAYVGARLDAQLDEQVQRFMADRSRNRYDTASGRLQVSKIFDWYRKDFEQGHRGVHTLADFFARHAERLADAPADRARLAAGQAQIEFLDYDWALNDTR